MAGLGAAELPRRTLRAEHGDLLDVLLVLVAHGEHGAPTSRSTHQSESPAQTTQRGTAVLLALAGTGYGLIGILVVILLIVLIVYFARRA